ncbi:MAG: 5-formyltetrahydrofolate cyclo-ligase [Thermodesulfobacteriota bacterium]
MNTVAVIKSELRTNILEKRNVLDQETARGDSAAVVGRLRKAGFLATSRTILLYLPVKNEVDTRELFPELLRRGTEILLPRCRDGESGELDLHWVTGLSQVRPGRFGILEPDPDVCPPSGDRVPEAALVPGVAFDRRGYRLGFGGGYYDRLFARPEMTGTLRVGLAFDFQIVEKLPEESWDKPMHALCTPREFVWIRP